MQGQSKLTSVQRFLMWKDETVPPVCGNFRQIHDEAAREHDEMEIFSGVGIRFVALADLLSSLFPLSVFDSNIILMALRGFVLKGVFGLRRLIGLRDGQLMYANARRR
jgi:hypothetical protein